LDVPPSTRNALHALLDADEQARAARFHAAQHRDRFAVAHGRLRELLAAQLQVAPQELQFAKGTHGKPQLAAFTESRQLHFNLSHSSKWGLVAMAWDRAVGADIEIWRPMHNAARLVRRFFSGVEGQAYEALQQTDRQAAFFRGWTRKEAYIKAVGRGLSLPLSSFDVSLGPDPSARLLRPAELGDGRNWALAGLDVADGLSAAVVLESAAVHIFPNLCSGA
jgi:4'-phosphopantetheinyl transferase